jgi:predicted  nucleic acid-binding Zn-ribbon protein
LITASKKQQTLVLRLSEFDFQIKRTSLTLKGAEQNASVEALRSESLEQSEKLLEANSNLERLQDDLKKVLADIEMADTRIQQDQGKAKAVSSERELKAVESELVSLQNRKSMLEDTELSLLEQLEAAEKLVSDISQVRAALSIRLEQELAKSAGESKSLTAAISELSQKRDAIVAELEPALFATYQHKAQRGVPVGQTLGRDCSACRLAINGVEFDAMMALPEDSLPTCPNCDAFIIR